MVTHLTTNPPVRCLNRAERTGSLVFNVLWSYVKVRPGFCNMFWVLAARGMGFWCSSVRMHVGGARSSVGRAIGARWALSFEGPCQIRCWRACVGVQVDFKSFWTLTCSTGSCGLHSSILDVYSISSTATGDIVMPVWSLNRPYESNKGWPTNCCTMIALHA